jgi:hypothetical protein
MLVELVKGAIGAMEWHHGMKFNVHRVSGLEAQPALLVLTATNLHLLTGFSIRPTGAGKAAGTMKGSGERVLVEWVAASPAAKAAAAAVHGSASSTSLLGGADTMSAASLSSSSIGTGSAAQKGKLQAADAAYNAAAVGLDRKEQDWLQDIWKEMLTSDPGYHRMPLDEVSKQTTIG